MNYVNGNILHLNNAVIVQQVSCQRVAGAGLAKQIKIHWPEWFKHYIKVTPKLGNIDLFHTSKQNVYVCSFYSQDVYGTFRRQTDYEAFENCLKILQQKRPANYPIYFPYRIGCGLAGGDWSVISSLINQYFPNAYIVSLHKDM